MSFCSDNYLYSILLKSLGPYLSYPFLFFTFDMAFSAKLVIISNDLKVFKKFIFNINL